MLCLCLDAFKPEYYRYAPFLSSLSKEGLSGELETIFGYTGIGATFFSGFYPDRHGVFSMFTYSPKQPVARGFPFGRKTASVFMNVRKIVKNEWQFNRLYNIPAGNARLFGTQQDKAFPQKGSLRVKTIFDILEDNGKSFSYTDYPVRFMGRKGSFFLSHSGRAAAFRAASSGKDFNFAHVVELDTVSHSHGTRSKETVECVKMVDGMVEDLHGSCGQDMFIWSDHGMVDVKGKVDIESVLSSLPLSHGRDYACFLDTTMARFWAKGKAQDAIREALSSQKNGRVLSSAERRRFRVPESAGDVIWAANPGFIVHPNFFQGKGDIRAAHGYDPSIPAQKGVYIATGTERKSADARMVDMMPTMLSLLGIKDVKCDGVPLA